jgi:hypothetical protein
MMGIDFHQSVVFSKVANLQISYCRYCITGGIVRNTGRFSACSEFIFSSGDYGH